MSSKLFNVSLNTKQPIIIKKWKVKPGMTVSARQVIFLYELENDTQVQKYKASNVGSVQKLCVEEGSVIKPGCDLLILEECSHPTVMADMCAECGADLRQTETRSVVASVPMVHSIPELKVSQEQAQTLGKADEARLLSDRKLVLLVDLDQTVIHTTNDNIPPNLKDVVHFQLYGPQSPWYHTRIRPGTNRFLESVSSLYELHICTFGARNYAHYIAMFLDPDGRFFSHRILSRDECFDANSKTANLKALFPCGDSMVCIIDDREDVWNYAPNLIHVKPYHFFQHTGDINAPPGLTKKENDSVEEGFDFASLGKTKPEDNGETFEEEKKPEKRLNRSGETTTDKDTEDESEKKPGKVAKRPSVTGRKQDGREDYTAKFQNENNYSIIEQEDDESLKPTEYDSLEPVEDELLRPVKESLKPLKDTSLQPEEETVVGKSKGENRVDGIGKEAIAYNDGVREETNGESSIKTVLGVKNSEEQGKAGCQIKAEDKAIAEGTIETKDTSEDKTKADDTIETKGQGEHKVKDDGTIHIGGKSEDEVKIDGNIATEGKIKSDDTIETEGEIKVDGTIENEDKLKADTSVETENEVKGEGIIETEDKAKSSLITTEEKETDCILEDKVKEDGLIEVEDTDDYLLFLEEILKKIHTNYYTELDERRAKSENAPLPDLKVVIPAVKREVLAGCHLVLSGLVPSHVPLQRSRAYMVAVSLGATVEAEVGPSTTHLVAARAGTAKVNSSRRQKGVTVVTPQWLWSCAERWEKVDERLFPLARGVVTNRHPPAHCGSPPHPGDAEEPSLPPRLSTDSGRFSDSINPLLTLSSEEVASMDEEVEALCRSDDSDSDAPIQEFSKSVLPMSQQEDSSSSQDSLSGTSILLTSLRSQDFMKSTNSLLTLSSEEVASMDEEVEALCRSDDSDSDAPIQEFSKSVLPMSQQEDSSSSQDSLSGRAPKGWCEDGVKKRKRKIDTTTCTESDLEEDSPIAKFRRGEPLPSDLDLGENSQDTQSSQDLDLTDDADWTLMGAALEREFLSGD